MITVFGHGGFIGSYIVKELAARKLVFQLPDRDENVNGKDLGKIIYCIGLTADAKKKPFETIDAHINKLSDIIRYSQYEDITYASSTRVYVHNKGAGMEEGLISIDVSDPFELFNLTKLTAESLLFNTVDNFKSVRYSNVYGPDIGSDNFLTAVIKEVIRTGSATLFTTPSSSKDYISVLDASRLTVDISLSGKDKIYNVAAGCNTSNTQIIQKIESLLGCEISYSKEAKEIIFPVLDTTRISEEFNFHPSTTIIDDLENLIALYRDEYSKSWN